MPAVQGPSAATRAPLGRRAFVAIVVVGLSAFAWGGAARDATKDVMPDSLLPWVLLSGEDHDAVLGPAVVQGPGPAAAPTPR